MTADPMPPGDRAPLSWPVPPPGGYFAEDLDHLSDLPPHTQLIDGSLVFVSPQMRFHLFVVTFLHLQLMRQAPEGLEVAREMTVTLGPRQRPEPDVMVVDTAGVDGLDQTTYRPEDVLLVVEVMSPDSVERDRYRKPQLYAEAGIPAFWRVENVNGRAVVYVYELDPATRRYSTAGIHHDRLRLSVPFEIDLDLTRATDPKGSV
ncbi:restriction endonuclease [Nocardia sp. MH4]|uniref:Uma2 family endonuclease n=1 Tax=unclassified Nocardia TaxID=2637762 RepID=UPI001C4F31C4|nr:Uma2 family endonuclease [Nocardia sp. MH4]MBW0273675.1 restriction endonuclease [Nocardia sp. MH4]